MRTEPKAKSVIKGVVVASKWKKDGSISGISIQGYDQKEYVVNLNDCGKRLLHSIQKVILVTGKVSKTNGGGRSISITHYKLNDRIDDAFNRF